MADIHYQFADLDWQERWNKAGAVAGHTQAGAEVMATGLFGVIRFRLDRDEDVAGIINACRRFADMVENTKREYDEGQRMLVQLAEEALPAAFEVWPDT
jgi:hypothetical protein